ncbi:HesA/MoeB/ThiF family protein [bacterium]|nr:HesA/MoeB/ThiF family protein [bacterium]
MDNMTRYKRNLSPSGISMAFQEKLSKSKVLVMGAGGLGSGLIMSLASLGVGQIKIVDDGIIETENFNRQFIHKFSNLKRSKVISAKETVLEYNPDIKIEIDKIRIHDLNYMDAIEGYDIIADCFDNYESKFILNEIALRTKKTLIHASCSGFQGQVTTIVPEKTGCLCCIIKKPQVFKNEEKALLSPVLNVISSIQALEILKVITGCSKPLFNKLLMYNALENKFETVDYTKNPSCQECSRIH